MGQPNITGPNTPYAYQILELRDVANPVGTAGGNIIGYARAVQLNEEITDGQIENIILLHGCPDVDFVHIKSSYNYSTGIPSCWKDIKSKRIYSRRYK